MPEGSSATAQARRLTITTSRRRPSIRIGGAAAHKTVWDYEGVPPSSAKLTAEASVRSGGGAAGAPAAPPTSPAIAWLKRHGCAASAVAVTPSVSGGAVCVRIPAFVPLLVVPVLPARAARPETVGRHRGPPRVREE